MKKIYLVLAGLGVFSQVAKAQPSSNQNYVLTYSPRVAIKDASLLPGKPATEVQQDVQYVDGLGRPLQRIQAKASPSFKDIIVPIEYDPYGREVKKYLPYSESGSSQYRSNAISSQATFYNNTSGIVQIPSVNGITPSFAETRFEPSPLNRVLEQGAPGANWQLASGHTVKTDYSINSTSDNVLLWQGTSAGSSYAAGELYKTITKDENWISGKIGTTEEFKDKEGRVILKRIWESESSSLSTYYVYDDFGNLKYVIPPAVTASSFTEGDATFNHFIYAYQYDHRNRLIKKKIPGKGWEELLYNKLDQVVLTRDAKQEAENKWLYTKYDGLGRVIGTGIFSSSDTRATLQSQIDSQPMWETRTGAEYPGTAFPSSNGTPLTVNYYDDYTFPGASGLTAQGSYSRRTLSMLTGSKVYTTDAWASYITVNYYDSEGRVIETVAQNHVWGTDRTINTYSVTGELLTSTRTHNSSTANVVVANRYTYDHMGRKKQTYQKTGDANATEVLLSELEYNEIGQLKDKKLHNSLQSISYTYNPRGWLKSQTNSLFNLTLAYEDHSNSALRQYNGNISGQTWGPQSNPNLHYYNYSYDKLNRLLTGTSDEGFNESLSYDVMGNISSLARNPMGTNTYTYSGNQLSSISGFVNGSFGYDVNGNQISDGTKGVTLAYNYLNLPQTITKASTSEVMTNTWLASGVKLKKVTGGLTRDYVGGIEYNNGSIEFIQTEEGRARPNGGSYFYEYMLKDHLGNTRVLFDQNGAVKETSDYYPFGLQVARSGNTVPSPENRYKYNGKELQTELGLNQYDYGARFYDPVIARWNVVDPKAELYLRHSTYAYVANSPIMLIDPNGMEILDINGGTRFTHEDAVNALKVLSGRAKNVYMDIEGNAKRRSSINAGNKAGSYGSWAVFSVSSFQKANLALGAFEDRSLDNLVLETHGIQNSKGESVIQTDDTHSQNNSNKIFTSDINWVNSGHSLENVSQLKSLADKVTDGGRFILASCFVGQGDGGKAFGASLNALTGSRLNTFLPTNFIHALDAKTSIGPIRYINTDFKVDASVGWLKVSPNGQFSDVRTLNLSTNAVSPVKIVK